MLAQQPVDVMLTASDFGGLAEELRGSGVRVSCLAPGPTETEWGAQAGMLGTRLFAYLQA